jgi:hypothetical protein
VSFGGIKKVICNIILPIKTKVRLHVGFVFLGSIVKDFTKLANDAADAEA